MGQGGGFPGGTNETLNKWGRDNCVGLNDERKKSNQGFHELHSKFAGYNKVEFGLAHGMVASDARVWTKAGRAVGIDLLAELKEAGVKGFVDTTQAAQQHNIKALLHTSGKHVLSVGAEKKMSESGSQEYRALDDSKATAEWVAGLPEVAEVMYGHPRRSTAISIGDLAAYYVQVHKHKVLSGGRGSA